jgi:hypothetical protein
LQPALDGSQQAKPATDHLFVSNIRFLSMAGVVFVHCWGGFLSTFGVIHLGRMELWMRQPAEFNVIGFF